MSISVDEKARIFILQTAESTYQMKVDAFEHLLHLYYGAKVPVEALDYLLDTGARHFSPYPHQGTIGRPFSLDVLPQEFPTLGSGDLRTPAFRVENSDGTNVVDLHYKGYERIKGKYNLATLPSFFEASENEAETLKITLRDDYSEVEVDLFYAVFEAKDVITRAVVVRNGGTESIEIHRAQSLSLDFISGDFDLIHFQGRWAMERQFERIPVLHTIINFGSNYGVTSPKQNSGFLLAEKDSTETSGNCYGFNLVYSGNFTASAEQSGLEQTRVSLGLGDDQFLWTLAVNESFECPEAILSFSAHGFAGLSHHFHQMVRENLCKSKYSLTSRPVLINNWEATYFDFTGEKLLKIAETAREIGVDLLVMDDGWFGNRCDDNRALGDWFVNEEKLGMTLNELTDRVNELGLKFGIWFEPEMVNEDSDLYRAHSDWVLKFPQRPAILGRNQLNLDLSKAVVRDYLFRTLSQVLDSAMISYVKWDMNRPITDWYSPDYLSGELQHRYVLGLYDLLGRLTEKYPDILFEGCSSGGARFDLGMLSFHPQIWTSDNTDAIDRLKIQYGTSFFYPVSAMGSHVAAVPNHQNGRYTPFQTRANVAMAGSFGYELDVTKMSESEKEEARLATKCYKAYQKVSYEGDYYRLTSPFEKEYTAWQIVSKDQSESLLTVVSTNVTGNSPLLYLKLQGLKADAQYEIDAQTYSGAVLMNVGLCLPQQKGDFPSIQLYLKEIS